MVTLFLTARYDGRLEVPPPIPGSIPVPVPIRLDLIKFQIFALNSAQVKPNRPCILKFLISAFLTAASDSAVFSISQIANNPIKAGKRPKPLSRACKPKVNLGKASIGAVPTRAAVKLISPLARPFASEPLAKLAINVSENTSSAKYSNGPLGHILMQLLPGVVLSKTKQES